MNSVIKFIVTCAILCFSCSVIAKKTTSANPVKTRIVQIEMITFQRNQVDDTSWKYWSFSPLDFNSIKAEQLQDPTLNASSDKQQVSSGSNDITVNNQTLSTIDDTTINQPFPLNQLLPSKDFKLHYIDRRLHALKNYTVLSHIAWYSKVSSNQTIRLWIPNINLQAADQEKNSTETPVSSLGWFQLSIAQYLNVQLTLNWQRDFDTLPDSLQTAIKADNNYQQQNMINFPLQQSRRMRYNELNYFDNPFFGVFLKIIPIKTLSTKNVTS